MDNEPQPQQLTLEQALSLAKKNIKQGNAAAAVQLYKKVLQHQPNHPVAKKGLRKLQKGLSRNGPVLVTQANPSLDQINALSSLYYSGQMIKTEQACRDVLLSYPHSPVVFNLIGVTCQAQGKLEAALAHFDKAIQLKSDYADAYSNRGVSLKYLGRLNEAASSFDRAIQIQPDYAEAYNNLGNSLRDLGNLGDAMKRLEKAVQLKPDYVEAYYNLGIVQNDLEQQNAAVASFDKAIQLNPNYAEAYNNRGTALHELGRLNEAVESYEKAIQLKADLTEAHSSLCELYDKYHMVDELKKALHQAQAVLPSDEPNLLYRMAQLASREKRNEDARDLLGRVDAEKLSQNVRLGYSELLAKTYDKLAQFSDAFAQYEMTNSIAQQSFKAKNISGKSYFDKVIKLSESWSSIEKPSWSAKQEATNQHSLAFLIGFPRSGTTLLDTILLSHPDVFVVEEQPMVNRMLSYIGNLSHIGAFASADILADLNDDQIKDLRKLYFDELYTHVSEDHDHRLIIDKAPLNIIHVGLIRRVFPDAKFILALRHPYDCVLSCFMQSFNFNDAMANFLTLPQSAVLYDAVMSLWDHYNIALDIEVGIIKYEDLICDLQGATEPLLNFLDLGWHDDLLKYQQVALSRGDVKTPSYNQVTQGLYTQASGRWKNYQEQIKDVAFQLKPWAKRFGYSTEV